MLSRRVAIQAANPAFTLLLGYEPGEVTGLSLVELVAPGGVDKVRAAVHQVIVMRNVQRLEVIARRQDGHTFDADLALSPIRDEWGVTGAVCILRDITGVKEIERLKDAFVSNVSHELRTPITSMKLNIALLAKKKDEADVLIARLTRECNRLNRIVEDLLTLSRLEQNHAPLTLGQCDLNAVAEEYVADRTRLADSRELQLRFEGQARLPPVQADSGLIGLALSVLLTNAFNYTPSGGLVMVRAATQVMDNRDWAGIEVSDNRPGIAPAEQSQLFVRFYRGAAGRSSRQPHTGLGLSIVKEIMERHSGRVDLKSKGIPGKGASFTLWLPVSGPVTET